MAAISRYDQFKVIKDEKTLKDMLESFPDIKAEDIISDSDILIRYQAGQRFDKLANDYIGDGRYWWAICLANDIDLPLGVSVEPGTVLRIPINVSKALSLIIQRLDEVDG